MRICDFRRRCTQVGQDDVFCGWERETLVIITEGQPKLELDRLTLPSTFRPNVTREKSRNIDDVSSLCVGTGAGYNCEKNRFS